MSYGLVAEEELPAVFAMVGWAYAITPAEAETWMNVAGLDAFRVLRKGGKPAASLLLVKMGQCFGGRSVSMGGIAGVAVAPEQRGSGAAKKLMEHALAELREEKIALSTLYPATRTLYRSVGYEPAGLSFEYSIPLERITARDHGLEVRPIEETDHEEVERAYRAHALRNDGTLDRGAYIWGRVRKSRGKDTRGFAFGARGKLEGYAYVIEKYGDDDSRYDVRLTDAVTLTPAAGRRLLAFLADHRSIGAKLIWRGGTGDPLLQQLPEVGYDTCLPAGSWMTRIVDVKRALEGRGYVPGLETEVHLEVTDPLFAENQGRFVLSVAEGQGKVRRGGKGRLKVGIRGLAPLYTGHLSPAALAGAGLVEGPEAELARASLAFLGRAPFMADYF